MMCNYNDDLKQQTCIKKR